MTIQKVLFEGNQLLKQHHLDIHDGDVEVLLAHVLGVSRDYLHINSDQKIKIEQYELLKEYLHERIAHVPVAHITGSRHFYDMEFIITKDVLIPRPETELLVQEALKVINSFPSFVNVADIGTGSGCIAISILKNTKNIFRMYATDISRKALKIAQVNADRYEDAINDRLVFKKGNLIKAVGFIPIDVLIANLPYLTTEEYNSSKELSHEPKLAFVGDHDGLKLYKDLFEQVNKRIQKPYYILLEIGSTQASDIRKLAEKYIEVKNFTVKKDLAGHDRVIIIELI